MISSRAGWDMARMTCGSVRVRLVCSPRTSVMGPSSHHGNGSPSPTPRRSVVRPARTRAAPGTAGTCDRRAGRPRSAEPSSPSRKVSRMTLPADDLQLERKHLTESRAALGRMRERTEALFSTGDKVAGDAYAAETLGRTLARRVAELADDPATPLFFGRLDFGEAAEDHANHRYHVGRRHVVDDAGEPMVLDWRGAGPPFF